MLTVDVGRVAAQANGAAFMHYGDTTVLSTATASDKPRDGIDFFPLSVEFEEKLYSVGKIPGGFNRREGKASENAILTARVIDRPMRPLFPKDYRNDVTLNNLVLSVDPDCSPEYTAMLGSAIATCISDIPFDGPCATTQIGMIDGEFIINPTNAQKQASDMALTVASTREKVIMIEAGAKEVPEQVMIEAIFKAHEVNQEIIRFIDGIVAECGKEKHTYESCAVPEELFAAIKEIVTPQEMEEAVFTDEKQKREANIKAITERLEEAFAEKEECIYDYIVEYLTYDYDKAANVQKGYLPDVDATLEERKGICFDYAALFASMLRAQNVPVRLAIGYVQPDNIYHAWNQVYIDGEWIWMDPTFGPASSYKEDNYTKERQY